jgi:hypothetical protein
VARSSHKETTHPLTQDIHQVKAYALARPYSHMSSTRLYMYSGKYVGFGLGQFSGHIFGQNSWSVRNRVLLVDLGSLRDLRRESHAGRAVFGCCITLDHMSIQRSGKKAVTSCHSGRPWSHLVHFAEASAGSEVKCSVYDVSCRCVIVTGWPVQNRRSLPRNAPRRALSPLKKLFFLLAIYFTLLYSHRSLHQLFQYL